MRFVDRHGTQIASLEDWKHLGKPAAESHWKPGRSAYELASAWIDGDAATHTLELLRAGRLGDVQLVEGIAEKKTQFDENPRGPRNHDLLIRGRYDGQPLVVAVEGKADEPFDKPLWKWRLDALARNAESGAPKRLDALTKAFFGTTLDRDSQWPPVACLGYQLLSALAGTLADARLEGAPRAVLLVHEFATPETNDEKRAVNARVLDDFLTRVGRGPVGRTSTAGGWITDPVTVRGGGERLPAQLEVQFAKLVTDRRGGGQS